jgi:hypothetical protein
MTFDCGGHKFMMRLYFGLDEKSDISVDATFDSVYEPEWFDDDIVKQMVLDIDKSVVVNRNVIDSPVLGQIPPQWLSGGVKGLILLVKYFPENKDEMILPDLALFGNNCMKWLGEITKNRDFYASIYTYDLDFPGGDILCENDGDIIDTRLKWYEKLKYIREKCRR